MSGPAKDVQRQSPGWAAGSGDRPRDTVAVVYGECQNCSGFVPLLARDVGARRSLIAGSMGPSELHRTSYHRHAVDGLPSGNRYKSVI